MHLSDGEVNLAILNANDPKEPGHPAGLYHFGFHIDDAQETTKRIMEVYPEGAPKDRIATYAEGRASDPDGNLIDISTTGWGPVRRNDLVSAPNDYAEYYSFSVLVAIAVALAAAGRAATVEEVVKKGLGASGAERKTFLEEGAKKEGEIVFYTSLSLTDYPKILPHFEKSLSVHQDQHLSSPAIRRIHPRRHRGARRQICRRRDRVGAGGDVAVEAAQIVGSLPVA